MVEGWDFLVKQRLEVGICGSSLFLSSIELILQAIEGIRIRRLGNTLMEAALEINMLSPHAVIFERSDSDDEQAAISAILQEHPGIKLIDLKLGCDAVKVFSASEHTLSSMAELAEVIRN